jgi:uncharacterized protein with PIN domain
LITRARLKKRAVTGTLNESDIRMKRSPPRCPYCKERLVEVHEDDHSTYVFDPSSGTYKFDDGELESYCPHCDAELYDVFPDGVCNYTKQSKVNRPLKD